MKRIVICVFMALVSLMAFADWSYGTASFRGQCPSRSMTIGGVQVWYNGSLRCRGTNGNVELWEGTGDICVVFPRDYKGRPMEFTSIGGSVQIRYL